METKELRKIQANQPKSQVIGEFLKWLETEKDIHLCEFDEQTKAYDKFDDEIAVYYPTLTRREQLLADIFEIDLVVAENERRAILEEIRNKNND